MTDRAERASWLRTARSRIAAVAAMIVAVAALYVTSPLSPLKEHRAAAQTVGSTIDFDSFAGATTSEKVDALNAWARGLSAGTPHPVVLFGCHSYAFNTPIQLWSGLNLQSSCPRDVREYSTGTTLTWTGAAGTSMFAFTGTQSGQSYPSDQSPRNITLRGLLFTGTSTTSWLPKYDPNTYGTNGRGHVIWMSTFTDVGWKNWNTIWWGWADGVTINGTVHVQGVYDTPWFLGGSENNIFSDGYSFEDANSAYPLVTNGLPHFRSQLSKSRLGRVMITARKAAYCLSVEGGNGLQVTGLACDAQDSDPMYGSGVRVTAGDGIVFTNVSFKGMMANPASASGGTTANRGWVTITGGRQIIFLGCSFNRSGTSAPSTDVPLVWAADTVEVNEVKWGFNAANQYKGAPAHLAEAVAGRIISGDPSVLVDVVP